MFSLLGLVACLVVDSGRLEHSSRRTEQPMASWNQVVSKEDFDNDQPIERVVLLTRLLLGFHGLHDGP